jgi:hypothetical protein
MLSPAVATDTAAIFSSYRYEFATATPLSRRLSLVCAQGEPKADPLDAAQGRP